ncbi:MAG TPA: hypothetical protein VGO11_05215 [Chthoniobacteraceae bacterium]|jgi:hypothetical protein|nr:hypothetical protein [Chthoniobacteraceae bacterium]
MKNAALWKVLLLFATVASGCGPVATAPDTAPSAPEAELRNQLNPATQPFPQAPVVLTAPPPPNPATVFPVSVRAWLPPAETPETPHVLAGDLRSATSAPPSPSETPMLATLTSPPERPVMPVPPLAQVAGPDPERMSAWVVINPATETRGRPPAWDRPLATTDPTAAASRDLALAPPAGLRETPPPFVRLNIPDPFEQIAIAELRNPPPDMDPPVTIFTRPPIKLVETVAAK